MRLAYPDPEFLRAVLTCATHADLAVGTPPIRLFEAQFRPGWSLTAVDAIRSVKPRVFLRFDIGDPPRRIDLVAACKRADGHDRWQRERDWRAHAETFPESDLDTDVVLTAVGRWGRAPAMEIAAILGAHQSSMPEDFKAVDDLDHRIVDDILDALALHGHLHVRKMRGFARERATFERSQEAFATHPLPAPDEPRQESGAPLDPIAGRLARIENMRSGPASHEALRRM